MNSPCEDIKDILEDESALGLEFGTNLFISEMPMTPDQCVVLYDTGGFNSEVNYIYERPTVQIRVRGNRGVYDSTYDLIKDIKDLLHGLTNEEINSARYIGIWIEGDVLSLGYDDNQRIMFSVNLRIHRTNA